MYLLIISVFTDCTSVQFYHILKIFKHFSKSHKVKVTITTQVKLLRINNNKQELSIQKTTIKLLQTYKQLKQNKMANGSSQDLQRDASLESVRKMPFKPQTFKVLQFASHF